jgi:hypothetical protein
MFQKERILYNTRGSDKNRGSIKCSGRNEAPKRKGAKQKFGNINKSIPEGTDT